MVNVPSKINVINKDITRNMHFSAGRVYAITALVRIRKNVTLKVDDGVTILIQNGFKEKSPLARSALVFEKGSKLRAQRLYVRACNADLRPTKITDNGGLWFLGNFQSAEKDNICTQIKRKASLSSFKATLIATYHLGRLDPLHKTSQTHDQDDDVDGLSILGVGPAEWSIPEVQSYYSADDGIDLTNSHIRLNKLKIKAPVEDGINLSSSRLEVIQSLTLDVSKTNHTDRDLFDFETDDGASFLELHAQCQLNLHGVFGDELVLASKEMPRPNTSSNNETSYQFKGRLKRAALIYSLDAD